MNSKSQSFSFEDKLGACIGMVIGLMFIGVGFWVRHLDAWEQATLVEAQGTVIDCVSRRERRTTDDREVEVFAPVIEFLVKGDRTRFTGSYQSYCLSQGKTVVVRYDPNQPATTARLVEPLDRIWSWVAFGTGGLVIISSLRPLLPLSPWWFRNSS